jgi:hypothetical protein
MLKERGYSINTRCTVPVPMPSALPIFNMPVPPLWRRWMRFALRWPWTINVESLAPTGIAPNHDALAQLLIGRHFLLLASLQWLRLDGKCGSSGAV